MKDKMIFWLDASLLYFGIANSLQKSYDCDLFAIIDITDRAKKFFQEQQLVKFRKVWYLHDHISTTKNPDLEYLASFEKKYNINLWLLAYNERIFYHYNRYYKFSTNEILSILEQECRLFESVLDEIEPDFLIIPTTNMHHNHLFYEICKARGIKILMLGPTKLGYRFMISKELDKVDNMENYANTSGKSRTVEELRNYLKYFDSSKMIDEYNRNVLNSKWNLIKASIQFLIVSKNSNKKTHYTYYGRSKFRVLFKEITYLLKKRYREFFINRNLVREIDYKTPFIYFPLHVDQERNLLLGAPFYTNQLEVITYIVKSLPVGYKLYIKEHPDMVMRGWHDVSFYKKIIDLTNVVLIHPSIKSEEIIKKCSLLIAIASTSSLEAAFYQKPSIIFVEMAFSVLPSVHTLKKIEELSQAIRSSLQKAVDPSDLNKYVNFIDENSFEIDWWGILVKIHQRLYHGGFLVDVEIPTQEVKSILDDFGSKFDQVALEHIKKIKQYKEIKSQKEVL
jgi:hypothetical protein